MTLAYEPTVSLDILDIDASVTLQRYRVPEWENLASATALVQVGGDVKFNLSGTKVFNSTGSLDCDDNFDACIKSSSLYARVVFKVQITIPTWVADVNVGCSYTKEIENLPSYDNPGCGTAQGTPTGGGGGW